MIFYNQLTELISTQFLVIALFEIVAVIIGIFVFKRKLTLQILLFLIGIAVILSLLSVIVARGNYGGLVYHERFGWPFQYYLVSRNIEIGINTLVPYSFHFDPLKFIANTFFWGFIPLVILIEFFNKSRNKKYQIFAIASLLIFVLLTTGFIYFNSKTERELSIEKEPTITLPFSDIR